MYFAQRNRYLLVEAWQAGINEYGHFTGSSVRSTKDAGYYWNI